MASTRPMTRRIRRAAAALAVMVVLGACSDGDLGGTADPEVFEEAAPATAAPSDGEAAGPDADGDGATTAGGDAVGVVPGFEQAAASGRSIVVTASMAVEVDDVSGASSVASAVVVARGGFLAAQQTELQGEARSVLVFRVPPDVFAEVVEELAGLGRLVSQEVSSEDVTDQLVDLGARIAAQEASLARLRELLDRTGSIEDLARVEQELLARETALEQLRAQERALADRVALSTLTVTLTSPERPPEVPEPEGTDEPGFADGLDTAWDLLADAGRVVAVAAGFLLPFLPLLAVAGAAAWVVARRRRRPEAAGPGSPGSDT